MAEIEKLKKEIETLKSNQGNGGASSSVDMGSALSTLWFQTIYANDLPAIGITSDSVVDLGLSVKWANFNVGASACYEYGDYFQWGETHTTLYRQNTSGFFRILPSAIKMLTLSNKNQII